MKKIVTLSLLFVFSLSFSQTFILPSVGVQSTYSGGCPIGTCSGTLLDPGGTGNYPNSVNQIYQTICPTSPGNCIRATFTAFNTEAGFDYLTIGNGPAQNSAVFVGGVATAGGQIWGTPPVPFNFTANNTSGCLTFRFNSDGIFNYSGFTASISCVPCGSTLPAGNSDACASTFICSNLGFNDISNGPGLNPTEGCGGSNCVTGENFSNWYTFTAATSGVLTFTLNPNTASDDFDYALFGPNPACGALGTPVRCSYAANTGNTGLESGATDNSEDVFGNGWTAPMNVSAGQTYMLMVNNWTAGGAGFNILFGGTATLGVLAPAVNSTSICVGQSAILTATPATTGGTFTWTPGGLNTQTISVSPGSTTSYSVVYATGGCLSPASALATVTVNSVPTANAGTTTTLTCAAPVATLSGSGGGTYSWSGPGITGGGGTANPTVNIAGNYSLAVTSPQGCTSAVSVVAISQNTTAPSSTASNSATLSCNTSTVALLGGPASGVSYQWSGPGFSGGTTSQNAVATAAGTYTLRVTDAVNGCTATAVTTVVQNTTAPITSASTTGSVTCTTNTINLTSTLAGVNYTWTAPSGSSITSGTNSQNAVGQGNGTYTLLVQSTTNGCTNTAVTSVNTNTSAPTPTVSNSGTLTCVTTTVNAFCGGAFSYNWSGPGIVSGSTTSSPVVNIPGPYVVTVTAANGCTATATTTVSQNTTTPSVTMPATQTITCTSPTVSLVGSAIPSSCTPVWTGGVCGGATSYTAQACSPNTYTLTVTNPLNGCVNSGTVNVLPSSGIPVVVASNNGTITCANSTVQVTASTTMTPISYSWTGPGIISGSATANGTVTVGGTYQCVVSNTLTGCTSTVTTLVATNTTVPTSTINISGVLTCSVTSVDLTSSLSGMNYTWSPQAVNTESISVTSTGPYTLTVMNPLSGCTFSTVSSVTQNTAVPTGVSAGTDQTLTCTSTSVTLSGSVTTPTNASVIWSGASVCGTPTSLSSAACSAGIYTLTATNSSNGCSATSTVQIFANAGAPTATITATALVIDCNNATQSVAVTSTPNTDVTYTWNTPPSTVSTNGDVATFNTSNTYICTVTNTLSNCSTPVQVIVTTNTTVPTIAISTTQTLTCANPTAVISTTTSATSFTWTGTSAVVSGQGTGAVTVNIGGDYTVTVTNAANGCTNTASAHIDADTNVPSVNITTTSTNSIITCQNPTVALMANVTPVGVYSYTWAPSGNTGSTENVTAAGVYNVTVFNAVTGCTASASAYTVTGNTAPPTVSASNVTMPCGSPSVAIGATANNVSYSWATSNGTILSGATTSTPVAGSAGDYIVTVTDNTNGCTNTATVTVASVAVTAAFTANPTSGIAPLLVNFTNQTPGTGNIYSWNFADDNNNTSSLTNPDHTYNATGNYIVTLLVTDASGLCSATATIAIDVFENSSIIVPNVFTPNGDGKNDIFRITTTGIKELNCDIFNRWGTKVATIAGVNGSWDGSNVNDGTFFFILTATGLDGTEYKQQGYLNVFK